METKKPFWNVEFIRRSDLRTEVLSENVEPQAKSVIDSAKPVDLLILSTYNNSPERIMRAEVYSQENLAKIIKYNEEQKIKQ